MLGTSTSGEGNTEILKDLRILWQVFAVLHGAVYGIKVFKLFVKGKKCILQSIKRTDNKTRNSSMCHIRFY